MQPSKEKMLLPLLLVFLVPVYLYGIHYLPLRGEEANRILTAYEMVYFHDWFNLTHLGEPYYSKPPLFMWLIALFSTLFGWSQETARIISVISVFLTALVVYLFAKRLLGNSSVAFLSSAIFLTFGDLALFYGFLAEIDAFHTFIYTLGAVGSFLLLSQGKEFLAYTFGGLLTALTFLTKGLPAFYHLPLTFLIFLIYTKRWRSVFSPKLFSGIASLLLPLGVWFLNLKHPKAYLLQLWFESFNRTPIAQDRLKVIAIHLVSYPLLNLRQMLPHSLYTFFNLKRFRDFSPTFKRELLLLITLIGLNYLPYLLSPGARGRYILILFPFIATLLGYLLKDFLVREVRYWKPLYGILFLLLIVGFFEASRNVSFFETYGFLSLVVFGGIVTFLWLLSLKLPKNWLVFTVLLLGVVKFGYINYFAPWRENHHPERDIAKHFSQYIPKGEKIRYLPERINMELCTYLDLFTGGIVLHSEGDYFVTEKSFLPKGERYEVIDTYKGWILGRFSKKGK